MVKVPSLAKHVSDAGWGMFKEMLKYKANAGCKLYLADPFYPSTQLCSCCGKKPEVKIALGVKKWTCLHCGTLHQRDDNAAKNLSSLAERHHKTCKSLTENIVLVRKDGLIN
jgi:putative transposase